MKGSTTSSHLECSSPVSLAEVPLGACVACQLLLKLCNIHSRPSTPVRGVSGAIARVLMPNFSRVLPFSIHSAQTQYFHGIYYFKNRHLEIELPTSSDAANSDG